MSADPSQPPPYSSLVNGASNGDVLSATRSVFPGAVHVVLAGELDLATVPIAEHELRRALHDAANVVLDLRSLTFIDLAGLNLVLAAERSARRVGRQLAVAHQGASCVQRMFELTRADRSLMLVDDPATAAASNGAGPHPT